MLRSAFNQLCMVPQFGVKFMTKKDWKLITHKQYWEQYTDDLFINAETYRYSCAQDLVDHVRQSPEAEIFQKGIGSLLYYMGKEGLKDMLVLNKIEKTLYKFKNEFTPRLAFGAYQGFIALSIDNLYMQEFFDSEFKRHVELLDWKEALEIIEACGKNQTLTREYLFNLMKSVCEPILIKQYADTLKYSPGTQLRMLKALINAKYFEEALFDPLVKGLVRQLKITKLPVLLELLSTLETLEKEGDFPRSIQTEIDHLITRLKSNKNYTWQYNFETRAYYTLEEMKNKREESTPEQKIGYNQYYPANVLQDYLKVKALGNVELMAKEQELLKKQEVETLLYDEFMLNKMEEQSRKKQQEKEKDSDDELAASQADVLKAFDQTALDFDSDGMVYDEKEVDSNSDDDERFIEAAERKAHNDKYKKKQLKRRKGRRGREDGITDILEDNDDFR